MSHAMRWFPVAALALWACGGHNTPTTPTPNPQVGSVTVTPATATINLGTTTQLTATVRDTAGIVMTGVTITWSSSTTAVATVSNSGVVTAVATGTTTITAANGGKSGTATVTVVSGVLGPTVATGSIGSSGGYLGSTEVGVTIPSGALSGPTTISIVQDAVSSDPYSGNSASPMYFIDGIPSGVTVPVHVRVKYTGTNSGTAAIGVRQPALARGDSIYVDMGLSLSVATDSSGYLVATVPVTGRRSNPWGVATPMAAPPAGAPVDVANLHADAEVVAMLNVSHAMSAANHFELWGMGEPLATMNAKVAKTSTQVEQAYTKLTELGYSFAFRGTWPVQVLVHTIDANGITYFPGGYPVDPNKIYLAYNRNNTELVAYPGTVIHELFHFIKAGIMPVDTRANDDADDWIDEATSTWVAEKHPVVVAPFMNPTAISWRAALFTGISNTLVANNGYGKAPMIKYMAKRWGDGQVKTLLTALHGPVVLPGTAFLSSYPEEVRLWWPDLLIQHMSGSLYPWDDSLLIPGNTFPMTMRLGTDSTWQTGTLAPLGVNTLLIVRDTAKFGPNFTMPIFLQAPYIGHGKLLLFDKTPAAAHFHVVATGDTVKIPGYLLQRPDSLLVMMTSIDAVAPFNTTQRLKFVMDLGLPEGDWYFPTIASLNNGAHFSCDRPGNTVSMAMDTNATQVWSTLSQIGTWKLTGKGTGLSVTHTWAPAPGYADSLRKYGITVTATMVTGITGDTIKAQAHFVWDMAAAAGAPPAPSGGATLWWLIVPVGALPFAFRRRTRVAGVAAVALSLLVLASCSVGQINFKIDETFDYTFTKMRFTADAAHPSDPLMQVYQGSGKTTINSYRSEYWSYSTNQSGGTDSVKVICTGSGSATYLATGTAYADGVAAPKSPPALAAAIAQLLGRDTPDVRKAIIQHLQ